MASSGRSGVLFRHLAAIGASLIFGGTVVATRVAVAQIDPATLAFLRYFLAAVCLAPFAWMIWRVEPASRRDLLLVVGLGLLAFGIAPWLFNLALSLTTASRAAVAMALTPVFGALIWQLVRLSLPGTVPVAALVVAAIGCFLAFAGGHEAAAVSGPDYWLGDLVMVLTALITAAAVVCARPVLDRAPVLMIVGIAMIAGAAFLLPPMLVQVASAGVPQVTNAGLLILLFLGIAGVCVQIVLWLWAADGIRLAHLSYYFVLAPVSGLVFAIVLLGEPPAVSLVIGMVLVSAGVLAAFWSPKPQRRERRKMR